MWGGGAGGAGRGTMQNYCLETKATTGQLDEQWRGKLTWIKAKTKNTQGSLAPMKTNLNKCPYHLQSHCSERFAGDICPLELGHQKAEAKNVAKTILIKSTTFHLIA